MIITERLVLKPMHENYAQEINTSIRNSYNELSQWLYWLSDLPSKQDTEDFCRMAMESFNKADMQMAIFTKDKNNFVGCIGFHSFAYDGNKNYFELGYWISTKFSGKGYILESVKSICTYAFEHMGAESVVITNDSCNHRSINIALLSGFTLEHVIKNHNVNVIGERRDTNIYYLVSDRK